MKINRILSTAGMCQSNSTKLRCYCNLMQSTLTNKWLFADDFVESHVCFISDDYLNNLNKDETDKSQVIVVVNTNENKSINSQYQITTPLTAAKIKDVLNQISSDVEFQPLNLTSTIEKKRAVSTFKSAFEKIRKNFFRKGNRDVIKPKRKSKQQFLLKLTKKIQPNELPPYKVVLLGSPASGKTTAIQSASAGKALNSDVSATDSVASDKTKTTVGIDYAEISMQSTSDVKERKLKLIGTPGQIKFNFVWDIVGKDADGFIILLDMSRPEPLSYLKFYLRFLHNEITDLPPIYCALTHCDNYKGDIISLIDCIESEFPKLKGIYKVDAREKEDITILLEDIYPQIKKESERKDMNVAKSCKNQVINMAAVFR